MSVKGILQGDSQRFILSSTINKIGRNPLTNNVVLNHQSVSKDHAVIEISNDGNITISDMHSSNGTFVNGNKISPELKVKLKIGDTIKFGKDDEVFKFNQIKTNNSFSQRNSATSNSNRITSNALIKKDNDELSVAYTKLEDDFNKLNAKHTALLQYASDLQKRNDYLEFLIKDKDNKISQIENTGTQTLLQEKDEMIVILQNENIFYNAELQKIKNCLTSANSNIIPKLDAIINDYLIQIQYLTKVNNEYKSMFEHCDKKWNELLKQNSTLKLQIDTMNQKWSEENSRFIGIIGESDNRLQSALAQIPSCYDNFNVNKELASRYLVDQVSLYINEKQNLLYDLSDLSRRVSELQFENERLKDEICINASKGMDYGVKAMQEKLQEMNDMVIMLKQMNDPEKKIKYEDLIKRMNEQITIKDKIIEELKEKFNQSLKSSNLFFDEKTVVNSISQAIKSRDEEIENLKNKLYNSGNINNSSQKFNNIPITLKDPNISVKINN